LLDELRQRGITVWVDGDLLRCSAPSGVLTPDLRAQLQERKPEILEFLNSARALGQQPRGIVPLQPYGTRAPVFAVPGHNGDVFCYRALAHHLGDDQPFFGLQPPGVDGEREPLTSVRDIASYFADQIRAFRPNDCYVLAGYCAGGTIAFELARQLRERGSSVGFVAVIAAPHPAWFRPLGQLRYRLGQQIERVRTHLRALASRSHRERVAYISDKVRAFRQRREARRAAPPPDPLLVVRAKVEAATVAAVRRYEPRYFAGRLIRFLPTREWLQRDNALLSWRGLAREVETYCGPDGCPVDQLLREPYAPGSAEIFRRCVDNVAVEKTPQPVAAA
jgi:thioesterase domain-containing protein